MEYQDKLKIANEYLNSIIGVDWEDLADINSLHDCNTKEDIIEACKERLGEDSIDVDFDEDDDLDL